MGEGYDVLIKAVVKVSCVEAAGRGLERPILGRAGRA